MPEKYRSGEIFRFGIFEVDSGNGELRKHGSRIRLQEQPFQILLTLLNHAGELVSRDELCHKIWPPDTFVDFEQGLATAVKKLRQALDDNAETPRYIETVPKRGYRFLAAVEKASKPESSFIANASDTVSGPLSKAVAEFAPIASPTEISAPEREDLRSRRAKVLVLAVILVAGAAIIGLQSDWLRAWQTRQFGGRDLAPSAEPVSVRPLTTLQGGEYEPALSPDGKRIAFVWHQEGQQQFNIYMQAIDGGSPARLTTSLVGEGSPVWSPDGRYIAFITCTEDRRQSALYVISAFGGVERKIDNIAPRAHIFDRQIDWSPDGNSLALVDSESTVEHSSIYIVSLNSGTKRRVTTPPPAIPGDSGPVFSRDGREIAFRRTESIGNTDLYIVSSSGGTPRRLTSDQRFTSGHAWTEDNRDIVFASKRSGFLGLWRIKVSGGLPRPIPGVTDGAYNLGIARTGHRLIFSKYFSESNIWQTDLRTGSTKRVLDSTRNECSPQYSPDGTRIAFRSDRTGMDEIWVSDASGGNAVPLTSFNGPLTGTPRWSPNGQFIVFDSRPNGNPDIYVVNANGGTPRRVTSSSAEDVVPSWSGDGRWLYFASNRSENWQVWKVPSETTEEARQPVQLTREGGFAAFESPDGKAVFYAKGRSVPGLWSVSAAGGNEHLVTDVLKAGYWGNWGVAQTGLFLVRPFPPYTAEVDLYGFQSKRVQRVALLKRDPPFSDSGFAVARDGSKALYAQVDQSSSEIILVENFH